MAKQRNQPARPLYRDALLAMRTRAYTDVSNTIRDAHESLPRRVRSRAKSGDQVQHLFDGVLAAFADQIMRSAKEGCEIGMAEVVADQLIQAVRNRVYPRLM